MGFPLRRSLGRAGGVMLMLLPSCAPQPQASVKTACNVTLGQPTMPNGWTYIDQESIDIVVGAFHDLRSGLFVETSADVAPGEVDDQSKLMTHARAASEEVKLGQFHVGRWTAPAGSCRDQRVRIRCPDKTKPSWTLAATLCSDFETERLNELVTLLVRGDWPGYTAAKADTASKDFQGLNGMSWQDVRQRTGRGGHAQGTPSKGFVVTYHFGPERAEVEFSREQRVIAVRLNR